jgi:hypothetical protein
MRYVNNNNEIPVYYYGFDFCIHGKGTSITTGTFESVEVDRTGLHQEREKGKGEMEKIKKVTPNRGGHLSTNSQVLLDTRQLLPSLVMSLNQRKLGNLLFPVLDKLEVIKVGQVGIAGFVAHEEAFAFVVLGKKIIETAQLH